jgi:CubicO group peptidase (beta-lactamase class C family)
MRWLLAFTIAAGAYAILGAQAPDDDPWPARTEDFRSAVQRVLTETGVPGAGLALVRQGGVEWAGGVGLADRDRGTPVTADTHFRAGSVSKTFIAMALVQLSEDGDLDLDTPVEDVASDVRIDNPWNASDPVRIIHLLQHTAGFDDMHFNEMYNLHDPPDLPLATVLRINPRSRTVRWRPGTRAAYSNPGFAVAGHVIETVTGKKYEDFIAERTFDPIGMTTSSFRLTMADEAILSKGYRGRSGPPVPYTQIYLRPAGNLHTSALELGKFVHVLLNWGETAEQLVIDPEYLSNMEHPRTSLASDAGLRNGYGSAIASSFIEGFPMLGHGGGIDGFASSYAYSTTRDVGYVVLLNSTHSPEAMRRISQLAVRYLKADVEPPAKPSAPLPAEALQRYDGYYHDANPRHQALAFFEWLRAGRTIQASGDRLAVAPVFGAPSALLPISDNLFRLDIDPEPTRVFTTDEAGTMVMAGGFTYAKRRPRWAVEVVRWPIIVSFALVLTPLIALLPWIARARHAAPRGFWWLKAVLVLCSLAVLLPIAGAWNAADVQLGTLNPWTAAIFIGSVLLPAAAILSLLFTLDAWRNGAGQWLRSYALIVSISALLLAGYLSWWQMLAFRPWAA